MKIRNLFATICASVALAACGGGGGDGIADPVSVTVPAWVTLNTANPALSANIDSSTSATTVQITFNSDESITFNLGGGNTLSVTNDDIDFNSSNAAGELFFFVANSTALPGGGTDADFVELVILDDPAEADIVALARIDQMGTPLGYETSAVIGNLTASADLPTGNATYTGYMIGSLLFDGGLPDFDNDNEFDEQYDFVEATAMVDVDFAAITDHVTVEFSDFTVPDFANDTDIPLMGSSLTGTATIGGGTSLYDGDLSGTIVADGTDYGLSGALNGGFFGADGQFTAGTFDTDETSGGIGTAEFVGNFAAN